MVSFPSTPVNLVGAHVTNKPNEMAAKVYFITVNSAVSLPLDEVLTGNFFETFDNFISGLHFNFDRTARSRFRQMLNQNATTTRGAVDI